MIEKQTHCPHGTGNSEPPEHRRLHPFFQIANSQRWRHFPPGCHKGRSGDNFSPMARHKITETDMTAPSAARVNSGLKGDKQHYQPDRNAIALLETVEPNLPEMVMQNVRFTQRVVRDLAAAGIEQFVDVGCGLPSSDGAIPMLHEVAWEVNPDIRWLYVDNDPTVAARTRALLPRHDQVAFLLADIRDPAAILASEEAERVLRPLRPIGWLTFLLWHFIHDTDQPAALIDDIGRRSAPGSVLASSHTSHDAWDEQGRAEVEAVFEEVSPGLVRLRDRQELAELMGSRQWLEPGLVPVRDWRNDREEADTRLLILGGAVYL